MLLIIVGVDDNVGWKFLLIIFRGDVVGVGWKLLMGCLCEFGAFIWLILFLVFEIWCVIGCNIVGWVFDILGGDIWDRGFFRNVFTLGVFLRFFKLVLGFVVFLVRSFCIKILVLFKLDIFVWDDFFDEVWEL